MAWDGQRLQLRASTGPVCPQRLAALKTSVQTMGVMDLPFEDDPHTACGKMPEPPFKAKFKKRHDDLY